MLTASGTNSMTVIQSSTKFVHQIESENAHTAGSSPRRIDSLDAESRCSHDLVEVRGRSLEAVHDSIHELRATLHSAVRRHASILASTHHVKTEGRFRGKAMVFRKRIWSFDRRVRLPSAIVEGWVRHEVLISTQTCCLHHLLGSSREHL